MEIIRSWREQKVMLKRRFRMLSDADFEFDEGHRERMLVKLAIKLNITRKELGLLLAELQSY